MEVALDLVQAAQSGDTDRLHRLVETIWPDAFRIAMSVLHDRALAEDAAQEACARVLVSLRDLRDAHAFRTWFYRLVVNAAIQETRRRDRPPPVVAEADEDRDAAEPDERAPPALPLEDAVDLRRAVADLDPIYRVPLVLRYYDDLSSREIGAILGLPAGTVRFRLSVARERLKAAIQAPPAAAPALPPS
jgi:RNA polymerase sigma-70 factor, ECF subfamily